MVSGDLGFACYSATCSYLVCFLDNPLICFDNRKTVAFLLDSAWNFAYFVMCQTVCHCLDHMMEYQKKADLVLGKVVLGFVLPDMLMQMPDYSLPGRVEPVQAFLG